MTQETVFHNIPPEYDGESRVLILGSFPSVRSREAGFFYAHPQNRFWPLLAALFSLPAPRTVLKMSSSRASSVASAAAVGPSRGAAWNQPSPRP